MTTEHYTVIEHQSYFRKAKKLLSEVQMNEIVDIVSKDPLVGEVMAGTGGLRKFRYAAKEGRGKSGGVRVMYVAIVLKGAVHLVDIFGKNEKADLTQAERNMIAELIRILKGE